MSPEIPANFPEILAMILVLLCLGSAIAHLELSRNGKQKR